MDGINVTVFAYGQTSSGKTHTMRGTEKHPGLIPLSIRQVFDHIDSLKDKREFQITVSYLEVSEALSTDLTVRLYKKNE